MFDYLSACLPPKLWNFILEGGEANLNLLRVTSLLLIL